jgi:hypothetical protein
MKQVLYVVLYVMLLLVVLSSIQSVWIGLTQRARYLAAFPGADIGFYYVTLLTSVAAGANSILIALKLRWAVWTNIAVGAWSVVLLEIVEGARINQAIVLVACASTTILPLILWRPAPRAGAAHD